MKANTFTKRLGRSALSAVAAVALAIGSGSASATMLSDFTWDTSSPIYDSTAAPDSFTTSALSSLGVTSVFADDFVAGQSVGLVVDESTGVVNGAAGDLVINPFSAPDDLEGKAWDWMIDTDAETLSVLYQVTAGSLTASSYVVAVQTYSTDLTDASPSGLTDLHNQEPTVEIFNATMTNPIPEAGGIVLLLSGFGLLGVVRARRQRG